MTTNMIKQKYTAKDLIDAILKLDSSYNPKVLRMKTKNSLIDILKNIKRKNIMEVGGI